MIELEGVSYSYRERVAVDGVDLRLGEGALIALLGRNGSGKSTLLKLMARVIRPSAGTIRYRESNVDDLDRRTFAREVAYLPQQVDAGVPVPALEAVVSGRFPYLRSFQWESDADYTRALEALRRCDAEHLGPRYLHEMSGGELKRVFLARALVGDPKLILLDEPFSAVDLAHVQQLMGLLRGLAAEGRTVLLVAHDLHWCVPFVDRVLVMDQGRLAVDGAPTVLMDAEVVKRHFGIAVEKSIGCVSGREWMLPMEDSGSG